MGYLSQSELEKIGFAELGENVLISEKATIYNPSRMRFGSRGRIDDFCIISAGECGIEFGDYVYITCYVSLIGIARIKVGNYVGISSKAAVYSRSDDCSGAFLVGPTIPSEFKNVDNGPVIFEDYSPVGAMCVTLPGVTIGEGTAVGASSLVTRNLDPWGIYIGSPLKFIKPQKQDLVEDARELRLKYP